MFSTIESGIRPRNGRHTGAAPRARAPGIGAPGIGAPGVSAPGVSAPGASAPGASAMTLSDRLITLAKDAETAGFALTADQLVQLAITIFDEAPRRPD